MDTQIMKRFREKLSSQKQNLLDWLQNTPTDTRKINLGPEKTDLPLSEFMRSNPGCGPAVQEFPRK